MQPQLEESILQEIKDKLNPVEIPQGHPYPANLPNYLEQVDEAYRILKVILKRYDLALYANYNLTYYEDWTYIEQIDGVLWKPSNEVLYKFYRHTGIHVPLVLFALSEYVHGFYKQLKLTTLGLNPAKNTLIGKEN